MNDPFGEAIEDFFNKGKAAAIRVDTNYTENEKIPPSWFFRTLEEMPQIEQVALKLCQGKVLDAGAAAGCHSIVLQNNGFDITALEISEKAAEIIKKRGIRKVVCKNILEYSGEKFDTILMLMNGTGIGETLKGLKKLLVHLKTLLNENGQILIDSTDISYLFTEEDGSLWIDLANDSYYGEMQYEVKYKKSVSKFKWLFTDFKTLKKICSRAGLNCIKAAEGEQNDYLAKITFKN